VTKESLALQPPRNSTSKAFNNRKVASKVSVNKSINANNMSRQSSSSRVEALVKFNSKPSERVSRTDQHPSTSVPKGVSSKKKSYLFPSSKTGTIQKQERKKASTTLNTKRPVVNAKPTKKQTEPKDKSNDLSVISN
jgi:hypothetical protein